MRLALLLILLAPAQDVGRDDLKKQFVEKRDALRGVKEGTPWVELGDWALANGLKTEAKSAYQKAWDLENDVAGARAGMNKVGYDLVDDKFWRPIKEIYDKRRKVIAVQDCDARFELAAYVKGFGLEKEWRKELETNLKVDPDHRPTREALGFTLLYGLWLLPEGVEFERKIDGLWEESIKAGRGAEETLAALKAGGWMGSADDVKRALEFASAPMGTHKDVPLETEKTTYPTGEYTYGVPESYKPWRKNPLIVFLHGGGKGVGDGDDYFPQIWPHSRPRGYLTICPTVLEKNDLAWNNPKHEEYLRAILREFKTKYNVDEERTYLMGHSMGGFGCFYHGTRMTDVFAAISPWSGGPNSAVLSNLKLTPAYIIHGKRDAQVNVAGSREAARQLKQLGYPHVYVEMDIDGHGVPYEEQEKACDWLARHRLNPQAAAKAKK